jgi:hypothetical protein
MRLKSSRNSVFYLLGVCVILIIALFSYKIIVTKKRKTTDFEAQRIKQKTALRSLVITLKEKHYKKIKDKRDQSLADGIMETNDNDYVPAKITYNGETYKASIRLKGDWTDHLTGIKWSYRIKLKGNKTILGMRKFSIHHPKTRGYINEWLFHKINKDESLMGLRYHFAEGFLKINLKNSDKVVLRDLGIYAIEESFDKRTIESNKRKEGVILRISENCFWREVKQSWHIGNLTGTNPNTKRRPRFFGSNHEYISTFGYSKIASNKTLKNQFILAKNLLELYRERQLLASEIFDTKKLALHTALNNLFGAYHGLETINIRLYYNPITSKLEPISYDGNSGGQIKRFFNYFGTNAQLDIKYRKALILALETISKQDYIDDFLEKYNNETKAINNQLKKEFGDVSINIENLIFNQTILKNELMRLKAM